MLWPQSCWENLRVAFGLSKMANMAPKTAKQIVQEQDIRQFLDRLHNLNSAQIEDT